MQKAKGAYVLDATVSFKCNGVNRRVRDLLIQYKRVLLRAG